MKKKFLLILLGSLFFTVNAVAEVLPRSYGLDRHVQVVTYDPNQVYRVTAMQGFTTAIELGPDEKIVSANIGDSSAWLVNVQDNIIHLKPIADNPNTNLNLTTSRGTYQFFLTAPRPQTDESGAISRQPTPNTIFLLRFRYPGSDESKVEASSPSKYPTNWRYTAQGDATVVPVCVFDNGRFTFFDFGQRKDIPAIFSVDSQKNESLVNYHVQGRYVVVEMIGRQFTLRNGNQVATIFNEAPL